MHEILLKVMWRWLYIVDACIGAKGPSLAPVKPRKKRILQITGGEQEEREGKKKKSLCDFFLDLVILRQMYTTSPEQQVYTCRYIT